MVGERETKKIPRRPPNNCPCGMYLGVRKWAASHHPPSPTSPTKIQTRSSIPLTLYLSFFCCLLLRPPLALPKPPVEIAAGPPSHASRSRTSPTAPPLDIVCDAASTSPAPLAVATMSVLPADVHAELTQLLQALQSPDNSVRSQAEEHLQNNWTNTRPEMLLMGLAEQIQGASDTAVRALCSPLPLLAPAVAPRPPALPLRIRDRNLLTSALLPCRHDPSPPSSSAALPPRPEKPTPATMSTCSCPSPTTRPPPFG